MDDSLESSRAEQKVKRIFERFDENRDGGLNTDEMTAFILAVSRGMKLAISSEEVKSIFVDHIFETYPMFINGDKGLNCEGLRQTYIDELRNLNEDFHLLGLVIDDPGHELQLRVVQDVRILIARLNEKQTKDGKLKEFDFDHVVHYKGLSSAMKPWELGPSSSSSSSSSCFFAAVAGAVSTGKIVVWKESDHHYRDLKHQLREMKKEVDGWSREEAFYGHMEIGMVLYQHHLFNDALNSFKSASEFRPTHVMPRFWAGNCLYMRELYEEAVEEFSFALEAAQSDGTYECDYLRPQIHINLGSSLQGNGMVPRALESYKDAAILDPTNYMAFKLLASALYQLGDYSIAKKALVRAIFLKLDSADAYCDIGLVLNATGQREMAIRGFRKAMELKPDHVNAMYNLGNLYMDVGDHPMSLEMYAKVLVICPYDWRVQFNRSVVLSWAGDSKEAKKAIQKALKMSKKVDSHELIAHIEQLQEKIENTSGGACDEQIKAILDKVHESHIKFVNIQKGFLRNQAFRANYEELAQLFGEERVENNQGTGHEEIDMILDEILVGGPNSGPAITRRNRRKLAKQ